MNARPFLQDFLKADAGTVLEKAEQLTNLFPYFELAYLAKPLFDTENRKSIGQASFFTQNNQWLNFLLFHENEIVENEQSPIISQEKARQTFSNEAEFTIQNQETPADPVPVLPKIEVEQVVEQPVLESIPVTVATNAPEMETSLPDTVSSLPDDESSPSISLPEENAPSESKPETNIELVLPALEPVTADEKQQAPVFEPFYTVDYFAAQGIKMQQNPLTEDKLGKQVKSFTEWLKSMKKVQNTAIAEKEDIAPPTDVHIVTMAEKSLQKEEILTETMAEVLIKQGKTHEAIALLEKLSLQDTEKSSYFASRINDLKTK